MDLYNLPPVPFSIYFLDRHGHVFPKRIFTVTRKRININSKCIQLYILELDKYAQYDAENVHTVAEFLVN